MDVTVSIASSINEIYEHNKNIKILPLYRSAIKIGNDIIGTMINTFNLGIYRKFIAFSCFDIYAKEKLQTF